jgi:alcohol/geraniol dehydrogenase (NADP+)
MTQTVHALAATEAGGKFGPFEYKLGELQPEQVDIEVTHCGVCHSDLSMLNNEWGVTQYPFVAGHEIVGRVVAAGAAVRALPGEPGNPVGKTVGLGWFSQSCLACRSCLAGNQNLCSTVESTIIGRHGGFATRVRCHWGWATPLPAGVSAEKAGPLFCGGITVFNPLIQNSIAPTDRVGVVGIGGLGHMALQFLNKWGCEVYAFTSSDSKRDEAKSMGAHHVVNSRNRGDVEKLAGRLDFVLSTVSANLDWEALMNTLAPRGRLHMVGVAPDPLQVAAFPLIAGQRTISGTPLGSPATTAKMLEFCARHAIAPVTEIFPMSQANEAFAHLEAGKARYRVVLKNDLN